MLTQQLSAYWSKVGLKVGGANSPEAIGRFEAQWQVTLPPDMRDYFSRIGGMAEYEMDPQSHFYFWSLHELSPVTVLMPDRPAEIFNGYYAFADFLIHSFVYVINLNSGASGYGSIATYDGDKLIPMAASFTEFIHIYLSDPWRLAAP